MATLYTDPAALSGYIRQWNKRAKWWSDFAAAKRAEGRPWLAIEGDVEAARYSGYVACGEKELTELNDKEKETADD